MSEAKVSRQSGVVQCRQGARRSAGATHPGYRREQNEDAYWADEQRGVWVVADGLGGHHAGELASKTVVEEIQHSSATDRHYEQALRKAHTLLLGDEHCTANMGSTAVVLAEEGDYFRIYWVGDSRAYLWAPGGGNGELSQLTNDHSYVQMLMDSGAINSEEAASHPNRHVITRCIGGSANPNLEIDRVSYQWAAGQKLLLCSDGLCTEVPNEKIAQILAENADNHRAVDLLIGAALDAGGRDNITVQIIDAPPQAPALRSTPDSAAVHNKPLSGQFQRLSKRTFAALLVLAAVTMAVIGLPKLL
ncbi:PP2C family serine/threonine-protein phosphatase [Microbulbifer sp. 2205BS26-8]|uniref:PP2C family protein-serine/threonine phosphatase n=1 Tax=Microbulbifer sp. 2205BS26-8 TaxID=3064386 RepID=UPI00273DD9AF|nr:protein phosphatase 2C domain-containing protein [Microbulbifer sp. 2205BS26-8]MDP5208655.1 protein phosphatase 2C domain-containing protein [Microbulbifer sp. 2205BS26-8]